jgi:hypothetical protein
MASAALMALWQTVREFKMRLPVIGAVGLLLLMGQTVYASTQICDRPPYGMTVAGFKAAVKDIFEPLGIVPTKFLPVLCMAKFGGGDRASFYNLGLTDHDIDSDSMDQLVIDYLNAVRQFTQSVH